MNQVQAYFYDDDQDKRFLALEKARAKAGLPPLHRVPPTKHPNRRWE